MIKIAVVGAGGIGSWLLFFIYDLLNHGQLNDVRIYMIDDEEVEDKNIKYQYYRDHEIFEPKVSALKVHFGHQHMEPLIKRITDANDLNSFDIVICCVDNNKFRKLLFEYMEEHPEKYWIDMRSEGRSFAIFHKHKDNTLDKMLATLGQNLEETTSCQREYELKQGIIQQGNKIVASIGSQYLLNYIRGERSNKALMSLTI